MVWDPPNFWRILNKIGGLPLAGRSLVSFKTTWQKGYPQEKTHSNVFPRGVVFEREPKHTTSLWSSWPAKLSLWFEIRVPTTLHHWVIPKQSHHRLRLFIRGQRPHTHLFIEFGLFHGPGTTTNITSCITSRITSIGRSAPLAFIVISCEHRNMCTAPKTLTDMVMGTFQEGKTVRKTEANQRSKLKYCGDLSQQIKENQKASAKRNLMAQVAPRSILVGSFPKNRKIASKQIRVELLRATASFLKQSPKCDDIFGCY